MRYKRQHVQQNEWQSHPGGDRMSPDLQPQVLGVNFIASLGPMTFSLCLSLLICQMGGHKSYFRKLPQRSANNNLGERKDLAKCMTQQRHFRNVLWLNECMNGSPQIPSHEERMEWRSFSEPLFAGWVIVNAHTGKKDSESSADFTALLCTLWGKCAKVHVSDQKSQKGFSECSGIFLRWVSRPEKQNAWKPGPGHYFCCPLIRAKGYFPLSSYSKHSKSYKKLPSVSSGRR